MGKPQVTGTSLAGSGIPTILALRPREHLKKIWEAFIFIGSHLGAKNLNGKSQVVMLVPSPPVAMLRLPVSIGKQLHNNIPEN